MKLWGWFVPLVLLATVLLPSQAQDHGHEGDLQLGHKDGVLAILSPEEIAQEPYRLTVQMEPTGLGFYVVDIGIDFAHEHDGRIRPQHEPMLKQVTLQQLFITPGLFGVVEGEPDPVFGESASGVLTLVYDPNDPESVHKHVVFATSQFAPPSVFQFRLTNGIAFDGAPLGDSVVYTIEFQPVPEPGTFGILATGVGILLLRRRRG
ncbi:MAG: PEP-CTERM sorting domain-containing protein [Armatimonadota bacterium]|nr:PEP-CTERM sorting domain-containing protein [bacterium]MDW8320765.1 PEP-CTERM sorting domain-containing protein [Armatimonadota bacterium]